MAAFTFEANPAGSTSPYMPRVLAAEGCSPSGSAGAGGVLFRGGSVIVTLTGFLVEVLTSAAQGIYLQFSLR